MFWWKPGQGSELPGWSCPVWKVSTLFGRNLFGAETKLLVLFPSGARPLCDRLEMGRRIEGKKGSRSVLRRAAPREAEPDLARCCWGKGFSGRLEDDVLAAREYQTVSTEEALSGGSLSKGGKEYLGWWENR